MSTNAKVIRTLIVTSPEYLYNILKTRNEFYLLIPELVHFLFLYEKWINGCRCDDDSNSKIVNECYNQISKNEEIKSKICQEFDCSGVNFHAN
jgi:hypothetical protein